jgi:hypothetical protein
VLCLDRFEKRFAIVPQHIEVKFSRDDYGDLGLTTSAPQTNGLSVYVMGDVLVIDCDGMVNGCWRWLAFVSLEILGIGRREGWWGVIVKMAVWYLSFVATRNLRIIA